MPDTTVLAGRYQLDEPLGGTDGGGLPRDRPRARAPRRREAPRTAANRRGSSAKSRAAAALSSPNVVQLFDYGEADGRRTCLEHLSGGTLEERLTQGTPLPDAETDRIARDIATGLAHSARARPRASRPEAPNILFDSEDRAKIADFGIARSATRGRSPKRGRCSAPRRTSRPSRPAASLRRPASDVYSFGVMLFRMLTGSLPFTSNSAIELVRLHRNAPPRQSPTSGPTLRRGWRASRRRRSRRIPADRPPKRSRARRRARRREHRRRNDGAPRRRGAGRADARHGVVLRCSRSGSRC